VLWSEQVEEVVAHGSGAEAGMDGVLGLLANCVFQEQPPLRRKKIENLIGEYVHKRSVLRLIKNKVENNKDFEWLRQMRFYYDPKQTDVLKQLSIHMATAKLNYGFKYLGVQQKLVQTPMTDRCYLAMIQALEARLGGSPFGPAGTGKTETVKALGDQLGRFVLVFNCDEAFDFQAMNRIFVGLCQVGAWGCFNEFNRLEERTLSAVSQQIQTIQETLKSAENTKTSLTVELVGKQVRVMPDMAIFITMNHTYAGRSNLPDNLKKLFRSLAMTAPDSTMIAEVTFFSQGFRTAEKLALKIVPFFRLCDEQLSQQSHYDFTLRALKSVLASAGNIKRERINQIKTEMAESVENFQENLPEQEILIQSVCETMVADDIPLRLCLLNYHQEQELKQMVKDKHNTEYNMKELENDAVKENVYGSALLLIRSGIEVNPGPPFDISKVQAASKKIWNNAGQLMDVPTDQCYTYENMEECSSSLLSLLENVLKNELKVPFKMKKYQEVTLQAMSRHKDVIVISPPGSGKSLSTYAGASMLRKLDSKPAGVVLHLVPYNSIIKDKVTSPWLPTGYIMMGGATGGEEGVTEGRAEEDGDLEDMVTSNFTVQDLHEGKLSVIVCHPESLLSKKGDEVLKYLLRNDLLLAVMVDEFHKVIYWGCTEEELTGKQKEAFSVAFRPGMKKVVRKLKSLTKNVPFVFVTATLMEKEIEFALKTFSIKKPCIIKASPIQQQHCYLNLRRPDQGVPWEGDLDNDGNHISGLMDVIMELVLKPYIAMVKSETPAHQKIMVFSKNRATLDKIDQELSVLLPEESRLLPDKSPWYLNYLIGSLCLFFSVLLILNKKCINL
jgi:hypothetical protein